MMWLFKWNFSSNTFRWNYLRVHSSNSKFCGWNPMMWLFKWNFSSNTFQWNYLVAIKRNWCRSKLDCQTCQSSRGKELVRREWCSSDQDFQRSTAKHSKKSELIYSPKRCLSVSGESAQKEQGCVSVLPILRSKSFVAILLCKKFKLKNSQLSFRYGST